MKKIYETYQVKLNLHVKKVWNEVVLSTTSN